MRARDLVYTQDGTLRAPWRLLVFVLATLAFAVPVLFARTLLPTALDRAPFDEVWDGIAQCIALAGGTWYALRRIDHRPWSDVWLGRNAAGPARLTFGWLLGALAIGVPSALLIGIGWLRIAPQADGSSLAAAGAALAVLGPAALFEELLMRGYVMRVLRDALGWGRAIGLTSVVFGVLHAWNPGATYASIALVTLAGVFLGVVVMATRSLWAAAVAHLAWNWTMAALLHAPVSGLPMAAPDYRLLDAGPDWATGGSWGPEGGAGAAVGMLAGTAYLYARWRRRREET